jgi:hypothetical protein
VLDLLTSFCEVDYGLEKIDYGDVQLVLEYDDGTGKTETADIGTVHYDRTTYETLAGVVEVPIPPGSEAEKHIEDGWLRLVDSSDQLLLREIEVPQVETDDRSVYIDLPPSGETTGTMRLHAFLKGQPIQEPVTVCLEVYEDVMHPGTANSIDPLVVYACELVENKAGGSSEVTIPAGGVADVTFKVSKPGCFKLRFVPPGFYPPPKGQPNPNFAVEFFGNYRVLPPDDYSGVPDEQVTWPFVYQEVFQYYAVIHPVMSLIIPWGPGNSNELDPERITQFASAMKMSIDESRIGTALEMPITRELSAGKRALVQRWCDLQLTET